MVLVHEPETTPARPAYAIGVDHQAKQVVMSFRGTVRQLGTMRPGRYSRSQGCGPRPAGLCLRVRCCIQGAQAGGCGRLPCCCGESGMLTGPCAHLQTNLDDMLTDMCASCTPYMDGYAHWGAR